MKEYRLLITNRTDDLLNKLRFFFFNLYVNQQNTSISTLYTILYSKVYLLLMSKDRKVKKISKTIFVLLVF